MSDQDSKTGLSAGLKRLQSSMESVKTRSASGRVLSARGTLVEAELPGVRVGELCDLKCIDSGISMLAEVVGFNGNRAFLAPYGDLRGISTRLEVSGRGHGPAIQVGPHLLGTVIDASGKRIAGAALPVSEAESELREIDAAAPSPLDRPAIVTPLSIGLRSVDALMTCGRGQRLGIFGPAGTGKSTLVSDIVRSAEADVIVIGLIGERGREVGEFLRRSISGDAQKRTVIIAATSDRPAVERMQASLTATTVAEYFRDQGMNVLLIVDSITRLARAMREIGLAAGEPPTRRGFPPSVFALLPRLFERSGTSRKGSITGFYTVLVEGDSELDPIAEEVRSLLDGHIILSPELAQAGHYPAIDALESRSRLMDAVVGPKHKRYANGLRELISAYKNVELLIRIGEYQPGGDPKVDEAVRKWPDIQSFLRQDSEDVTAFVDTVSRLAQIIEAP